MSQLLIDMLVAAIAAVADSDDSLAEVCTGTLSELVLQQPERLMRMGSVQVGLGPPVHCPTHSFPFLNSFL